MIEPREYRERQARRREALTRRGYGAAVAWSRGGGTQDGYADVLYLTGFYTHQPYVPDRAGRWHASGHAAVVVPAAGPVTAVIDSESLQEPDPVADALRVTADPPTAVAELLAEAAPDAARVALLGGAALAARWERALREGLVRRSPQARLIDADELGWELRERKSPAEQALLRAAGRVGSHAMDAAMEAAVPGVTEAQVAATFLSELAGAGGALYDIAVSSGPWAHTLAPNGGAAGSAPYTTRPLEEGDLLRIDAYGSMGGYLFDFARSRVVGRPPDPAQRALLEAVRDSVTAGVEQVRPGVTLGEVARRCEEVLAASSYARSHGVAVNPMDDAWGHGLGLAFEPPWITAGSDVVVRPGMCLALERRIQAAAGRGAQHEENVLVTDEGVEILTQAR